MAKPNYYAILGLDARRFDADLAPQAVKAAYRRALLEHHPDKNNSANPERRHGPDSAARQVTVDDVAIAYKTLSEPALRARYDRFLATPAVAAARGSGADVDAVIPYHTGLETVDLDDLKFDEARGEWRRSCRCGAGFVVTEPELERNVEDGELIVGCGGCSLWLRVLFGVEG